MDCATYPKQRIQSIQSLCRALNVPEVQLQNVALRAERLYTPPKQKPKKNGGFRDVYDTKPPLKSLLKTINAVLFRRVRFPKYLTGSLAGRDYVSNVEIHKGPREVITEDIAQFFDDITAEHVYDIWKNFFGFSEDVSNILTQLTTKENRVYQGTPTSSYLANLAFWDREPAMVARLAERDITYSRYVDDVTISSKHPIIREDRTWAIGQIYGMISAAGFQPKRTKHGRFTAQKPITIMGLNANSTRAPTLPKSQRANIRAQVFQLERRFAAGDHGPGFMKSLNQASGRVGLLMRLHESEAEALRTRLKALYELANSQVSSVS